MPYLRPFILVTYDNYYHRIIWKLQRVSTKSHVMFYQYHMDDNLDYEFIKVSVILVQSMKYVSDFSTFWACFPSMAKHGLSQWGKKSQMYCHSVRPCSAINWSHDFFDWGSLICKIFISLSICTLLNVLFTFQVFALIDLYLYTCRYFYRMAMKFSVSGNRAWLNRT